MKQIGVALHSHHGAFGHFPVNQTASGSSAGGSCEPGHYSWLVRILPFVEQSPLYDSIDFSENMSNDCSSGMMISDSHKNARAAATPIESFLCPSAGAPADNSVVMGTANPAGDSYAANAGWPSNATGHDGERPNPGPYNGIISLKHPGKFIPWHHQGNVSIQQITDGTSHTAAVTERLFQTATDLNAVRSGPETLKSYHVTASSGRTLSRMRDRCDSSSTHADPVAAAFIGRAWISGWTPTAPTYMHLNTPNTHHCHFKSLSDDGDFAVTPSSNHPGGVNIVMADGHVDFISNDIEPHVWWALGSRDGGESETR
jgi:prepilin-type processing-associated H-X9-DG protein